MSFLLSVVLFACWYNKTVRAARWDVDRRFELNLVNFSTSENFHGCDNIPIGGLFRPCVYSLVIYFTESSDLYVKIDEAEIDSYHPEENNRIYLNMLLTKYQVSFILLLFLARFA